MRLRYWMRRHELLLEVSIHLFPMPITNDTLIWKSTIAAVVIITSNAILSQSPLNKCPSDCFKSRNRGLSESFRCIWTIHLSKSIKYIMSYGHNHNTEQYWQMLRFLIWCADCSNSSSDHWIWSKSSSLESPWCPLEHEMPQLPIPKYTQWAYSILVRPTPFVVYIITGIQKCWHNSCQCYQKNLKMV
jgi:hypothetical protein